MRIPGSHLWIPGLLILTACIGAGCLVPGPDSPSQSGDQYSELIQIDDSGFHPNTCTIIPGTAVTWKNTDTHPHAIVSDEDATPDIISGDIGPGESYTILFEKRGVLAYHCPHNPEMRGMIFIQT